MYVFLFYFISLFVLMAVYFKVADRFNIIDKPNERSSHSHVTVRGGGIIFPVSVLIYSFFYGFAYPFFLSGLFLISMVSFVDDIQELNGKIRLVFQFMSVGLLLFQVSLFFIPLYFVIPLAVFLVAMLNAWNFMDGINGLTGGYSLLTILTLIYINDNVVSFSSQGLMTAVVLSLVVFIFYNFRSRARCFAGDVGSVSAGFIIAFLMTQLVVVTSNPNYIILLLVYGLDATTTVFFRFIRKEELLEPHRSHLYQFLANEKGMPHNTVSLLYVLIQLIINAILLIFLPQKIEVLIFWLMTGLFVFVLFRFAIEGRQHLLRSRAHRP